MSQRATIIGDGGWGTALAAVLCENGLAVTVWGPFEKNIQAIRAEGENKAFLPGVSLPDAITWTTDRQAAVEKADVVALAVPTRYFRDIASSFAGLIPPAAAVVSVAKGLDADTMHRMSEIAQDLLAHKHVAALSGPSHAEEVARHIPTAVVIASADKALRVNLQHIFGNRAFRVYTSADMVGVELGGALKNVVAIAVGVSDGLGFGDNTRAALITRGLAEMTRLGCAMGAEASTFAGLSGMGDLIVTCTSRHSRNRGIGERLGRGEDIDAIMGSMQLAAEGVWNCSTARALARQHGVDMPITEQVHAMVHKGKAPRDAVSALLERSFKPEQA
jgi:glycerol-3-phosphate dehydrogenase (NAD(P)+)